MERLDHPEIETGGPAATAGKGQTHELLADLFLQRRIIGVRLERQQASLSPSIDDFPDFLPFDLLEVNRLSSFSHVRCSSGPLLSKASSRNLFQMQKKTPPCCGSACGATLAGHESPVTSDMKII